MGGFVNSLLKSFCVCVALISESLIIAFQILIHNSDKIQNIQISLMVPSFPYKAISGISLSPGELKFVFRWHLLSAVLWTWMSHSFVDWTRNNCKGKYSDLSKCSQDKESFDHDHQWWEIWRQWKFWWWPRVMMSDGCFDDDQEWWWWKVGGSNIWCVTPMREVKWGICLNTAPVLHCQLLLPGFTKRPPSSEFKFDKVFKHYCSN